MFEQDSQYLLEKNQITRSFNAAAGDYQLVDQLQRIVADRLLERLELIKIQPGQVLDLGSGPGTSAARLAKYFSRATIFETDISQRMLQQAGKHTPKFFSRRRRICADAEQLAIRVASMDLVFSNLMLQWCDDLDQVLHEIHRVLRVDGLFIFSTFGPDTLKELRDSWQQADGKIHVNAFIDMHDIGDALIRTGLVNPVMETERFTIGYKDVFCLMRELKMLGAHNVNRGRRKTLTGKTRLNNMLSYYEKWRSEGRLPATYEVVFGHAWMPAKTGSTRIDAHTYGVPVSAIKHVNERK